MDSEEENELNFEEEFKKIRDYKALRLKNKNIKDYNFDVKEVEFDREEYLANKFKISEKEYIKSIKEIDLFYFDDFIKMDEESIKEVLKSEVDFQLNCFFIFDYIIKKGKVVNYDEESKIITLKTKNDIELFVDYRYHYIYGRINNVVRKTEFRKKMELFLKCKSIIVKKRKNDDNTDNDNNNQNNKIKNELLKELSDEEDSAEALEEINDEKDSTKSLEEEECMKVFNDVLKLNLKFEEKKKIDLINSVLNNKKE